ncbi:19836_t:CDS:1, partial [Gigaspora rosea]
NWKGNMPENCHNLSKPINFKKKLKTLMINEPENPIERQRVLIDKINDLKDLADANLRVGQDLLNKKTNLK